MDPATPEIDECGILGPVVTEPTGGDADEVDHDPVLDVRGVASTGWRMTGAWPGSWEGEFTKYSRTSGPELDGRSSAVGKAPRGVSSAFGHRLVDSSVRFLQFLRNPARLSGENRSFAYLDS